MPRLDSACFSRPLLFPGTRSNSSGAAKNMAGIGITHRNSIWRVGCVRPCSNISTRLRRSYTCARNQSRSERRSLGSRRDDRRMKTPREVIEEWVAAFNARDAARAAALYHDDATNWQVAAGPPIVGNHAIKQDLTEFFCVS